MTPRDLILVGLVVAAPVTLALMVALVRGYTISLHMTREQHRRRD